VHTQVVVDSLKARDLSGKAAANYAVPRFAYSVALGLFKGSESILLRVIMASLVLMKLRAAVGAGQR
jgi:hypothetical protein